MSGQLVSEFESLWNLGDKPPDVFEFIESRSLDTASLILDILLRDQRYRWLTNNPISVEGYLSRVSLLTSHPNAKLQLAVGEYESRMRGDDDVSLDEFVSRFSDISDSLGEKLRGVEFETVTSESTTGEKFIGRYRLVRLLGSGAHGLVWLAFDSELHRKVAIKVPRAERFETPEDAEAYLAEARTVASLDQPNIVPVHDVGRNDDGSVYVVSKFIEGGTLADLIKHDPPDYESAAKLMATIASALSHAHEKRLIHRDIKPANLLIEQSTGEPYVSDFGLAIREEDYLKSTGIVGTPAYMSPEQTRGEGHRLDARSDIFSLGVVLYELLTRKRPFFGTTIHELRHHIVMGEPRKPTEIDPAIPAELERICLKALAKRASDRYATSEQMADDLLNWRGSDESPDVQPTIVPRGLRSFDADDADYFLSLLPGPRDRSGLPESIYFWKKRIEETDADKTFEVGLIYGPSGCGKSSLVKAGLMPCLSSDVIAIYVEATPDDTERRILRALRKQVPNLPKDVSLVETFSTLRRTKGPKVVVIVDQFEQWLHAHRGETRSDLTDAFRQCDGGALQATVMVRDDFWLAASRFMSDVEVNLVQGHNIALVDLFDVEHAQKVLIKFGQSFAKLPSAASELSDQQREFVSNVANGLARDGKVVSVRLSLFAEMVKGKPWVPETLQAVGGTEGIGANFLEEAFSSDTANPMHRAHESAARSVLQELLPEVGTDIKGQMRSHAELVRASGYQDRPRAFKELMRVLDGELRLITPTEHEGIRPDDSGELESKYYQLTHDYLVPSLRVWLTRKQTETIRGRAELKLAERSSIWNAKSENRHLPSLAEWLRILWFTDKPKWSAEQRKMMHKSARFYCTRLGILALALAMLSIVGFQVRDRVVEARQDEWAAGLVNTLVSADIGKVPDIIEEMEDYRSWVDPKLKRQLDRYPEQTDQRLKISLALLPSDSSQRDYLLQRLLSAEPRQVPTIRALLESEQSEIVDQLWQSLSETSGSSPNQVLPAASALALYAPNDQERWASVSDRVVDALVRENSLRAAIWASTLEPARAHLISRLGAVFRNTSGERSQSEIDLATDVLEGYAADDARTLALLLLDADAEQFLTLFDEFATHGEDALSSLDSEMRRKLETANSAEPDGSGNLRDKVTSQLANATVARFRMGRRTDLWPWLADAHDPQLRTLLIHRLYPYGAAAESLVDRLASETNDSIRAALILALGEFKDQSLSENPSLLSLMHRWHQTDPDPGIHGAAEWLLQKWGEQPKITPRSLQRDGEDSDRAMGWYVSETNQHTMTVIDGRKAFLMGSPESERYRSEDEKQHERIIGRRFAISTKEVTVKQFQEFLDATQEDFNVLSRYAPQDDCPRTHVSWYQAAKYCRWLSKQEGIVDEEMCYPELKDIQPGMKMYEDFLSRSGYRLPTEAEWELACRAGTTTSRYFGRSDDLVKQYAWYSVTSQDRTWPVATLKPNNFGLFDMYGNVWEWCQEQFVNDLTKVQPNDAEQRQTLSDNVNRAMRGGSFDNQTSVSRSAFRRGFRPTSFYTVGFRICRTYPVDE